MENLTTKEIEFLKKIVSEMWFYKINNTLSDDELQKLYVKLNKHSDKIKETVTQAPDPTAPVLQTPL